MLKHILNTILLTGVFISISVANVQFTTTSIVNGSQIAMCNSTVSYTCLIKSYTLMFFLIDDSIVVSCAEQTCSHFQAMPSNADFTYNTTAGIFNLTFNKIKQTDTGQVIKCSDGTSSNDKEITLNVKDYKVSFEEVSGPTGYEIKIVTGCISNTTKLSFVWNMFQANSSDVKEYTGKNETMSLDTHSCLHDPICGSSESVKHVNILSVMETKGGSKNFIQAIILFLEADISYSVKINSKRVYAISDKEHKAQTNSTTNISLIVLVVLLSILMLVLIGYTIYDVVKRFTEHNNERYEIGTGTDDSSQRQRENTLNEGDFGQSDMTDVSFKFKSAAPDSKGITFVSCEESALHYIDTDTNNDIERANKVGLRRSKSSPNFGNFSKDNVLRVACHNLNSQSQYSKRGDYTEHLQLHRRELTKTFVEARNQGHYASLPIGNSRLRGRVGANNGSQQ